MSSTLKKRKKKEEVASKHADLEKVKEALEKDPGEVFNRALDLLRKESPEDFEDPYLTEQYVNSLGHWIGELQMDLKLLDILEKQGLNACANACVRMSGESRAECYAHCRDLKDFVLEGRFDEPPI
jgi:hypothetical protein